MTEAECLQNKDLIEKINELIEIIEKKIKIRQALASASWIALAAIPGYPPAPESDDDLLEWWEEFLVWWNSEERC